MGIATAAMSGMSGTPCGFELRQLARHFAVLRHHVNHADQRDDRGVDRAEKEQAEDDADDDAHDLADGRDRRPSSRRPPPGSAACLLCARLIPAARFLGNESIAQPRSAVPTTTSIATGTIAFVAVRVTFGRSGVESGIGLHHAGDVRDRFDAAQRQDYADERDPGVPEILVRRFQIERVEMRRAQENDQPPRSRRPESASQMETLPLCFGPK